jgi:hypothetical protein
LKTPNITPKYTNLSAPAKEAQKQHGQKIHILHLKVKNRDENSTLYTPILLKEPLSDG